MGKFFPKIDFVDKIPEEVIEHFECSNSNLGKNDVLFGTVNYDTDQIYVLKGKKSWLVLLHEIVHWIIFLFCKRNNPKIHKWFDKHFTVMGDYEKYHSFYKNRFERKNELVGLNNH